MKSLFGRVCIVLFLLVLSGFSFNSQIGFAKVAEFPVYDCMEPNVGFWIDIYSKYSTRDGVIHDSLDLNIIYEVIDLEERWKSRAARKRNKKKIKNAKGKYQKILKKFAQGKKPSTSEEQRVFSLFKNKNDRATFREAQGNVRFQLGQKDVFRIGVIRSGAYLNEIKTIFKKYGLPQDLAYLPHVESSFNYKAYSKFGASGIWQFTRSTGKLFMTVGYTLDERRDPILATHAAAKFLKENYEKLGSWPLAITAYNHGANGMMKAKAKKGGYEGVFKEYEGRLFKFASRNFYSEFIAAKEVATNYRQYFGRLQIDLPVRFQEIELKAYASIQDIVDYFKVDMGTFRQLNPGLREPVYSGQKYIPKGYKVRLPEQYRITRLAKNIPDTLFKPNQKRSSFYLVRRGDTAGSIARMHRVKLRDLILANNLNSRATIYAGQNLRIPKPGEKAVQLASVSKKQVAEKRLASLIPQIPEEEKKTATPDLSKEMKQIAPELTQKPEKEELPLSGVKLALVKSRDDDSPGLSSLKTENKKVIPAVGLEDQQLAMIVSHGRENEGVESPAQDNVEINPAVVTGHLQVEKLIKSGGKTIGIIRIEAEETLGHYADWLGIRAQEIRRLNGFRYGKAIRVDQIIKIPLDKVDKDSFEEKRYEYHKEMEEDFLAAYKIDGINHYKIKKGDNIWTLCKEEFELPFWLIKKYNSEVDFGNLKPSQQLVIPVVESVS